jgi:hypothetical protein
MAAKESSREKSNDQLRTSIPHYLLGALPDMLKNAMLPLAFQRIRTAFSEGRKIESMNTHRDSLFELLVLLNVSVCTKVKNLEGVLNSTTRPIDFKLPEDIRTKNTEDVNLEDLKQCCRGADWSIYSKEEKRMRDGKK